MFGIFPEFPGTDFQRYNLDWMLRVCKRAENLADNLQQEITSEVQRIVSETLSDDNVSALIRGETVLRGGLAVDFPGSLFVPGQMVLTKGYHVEGLGCAFYVISNSAGHGAIAISDNVFANPIMAHSPEQFGAWGDGVHDDTIAVQLALDTTVCQFTRGALYRVTDNLSMSHNFVIDGNNATIVRDIPTTDKLFFANNCNASIFDLRCIDGVNAPSDNTIMVWAFDNCENVYMENCNFRAGVRTNWYLTVSCRTLTMRGCYINAFISTYAGGEWGDGLHVIKADSVSLEGCNIIGGDDACAFVPQGNVGLHDGTIRIVNCTNCNFSSPLYSAVKVGRYNVSNAEQIAEPTAVTFTNCTFTDSDRWVSLIQYYTNFGHTDITFVGCIFKQNHSKTANQPPFNMPCVNDNHGGGYHLVMTGCTIRDDDPSNANALFNLASAEKVEIMGCYIRAISPLIFNSFRPLVTVQDVTVSNCIIEHTASNCRGYNNGAINGDVTFMNNRIFVTGTLYQQGYFYALSTDTDACNVVNNFWNQNLVGTFQGGTRTIANNVMLGTH